MLYLVQIEYNKYSLSDILKQQLFLKNSKKENLSHRLELIFSFSFSMTMEGCTRVISRAEVEEVVQGCTIHTGAPGVSLASITVRTSGAWGLHTLSIHRPRRNHPNTFLRRRPQLQHPRYPTSTNATRMRSTGESSFLFFLILPYFLSYMYFSFQFSLRCNFSWEIKKYFLNSSRK